MTIFLCLSGGPAFGKATRSEGKNLEGFRFDAELIQPPTETLGGVFSCPLGRQFL